MLECLSLKSSSGTTSTAAPLPNSPPTINLHNCPAHSHSHSQGNSFEDDDGTSRSSTQTPQQATLAVDITSEYNRHLQTHSYKEMLSRIIHQLPNHQDLTVEVLSNNSQEQEEDDGNEIHTDSHCQQQQQQLLPERLLSEVLHPNRDCVEETLRQATPNGNTLRRLVTNYFQHSEDTTHLCISLHLSVYRARALYGPLHRFLDVLPVEIDQLSQPQCDHAFGIFQEFDCQDNPFSSSDDSNNFDEMRRSFSLLRQQLNRRLHKSRSRVRLARRAKAGTALCLIGTTLAVVASAAAIATHALVAIVACPFLPVTYLPRNIAKKELARVNQLDAAARGTFVLNNHLGTINCLVAYLFAAVEGDKHLIRLGLERGSDMHPVLEVLKLLRKNHHNFIDQLNVLEEHIYLYFHAVNRSRSLLLREINHSQGSSC